MRRPLHLVAALGPTLLLPLLAGHALAQYADLFGVLGDEIAPRFGWEPSLARRDGACGSGKHPCASH